jgi:hypothetical protein
VCRQHNAIFVCEQQPSFPRGPPYGQSVQTLLLVISGPPERYKSGRSAEPTSIDVNPTFQSITDHRSSKNALSQAAGVRAGIVESKASIGAFGDSKGISC